MYIKYAFFLYNSNNRRLKILVSRCTIVFKNIMIYPDFYSQDKSHPGQVSQARDRENLKEVKTALSCNSITRKHFCKEQISQTDSSQHKKACYCFIKFLIRVLFKKSWDISPKNFLLLALTLWPESSKIRP